TIVCNKVLLPVHCHLVSGEKVAAAFLQVALEVVRDTGNNARAVKTLEDLGSMILCVPLSFTIDCALSESFGAVFAHVKNRGAPELVVRHAAHEAAAVPCSNRFPCDVAEHPTFTRLHSGLMD